MLLRTHAKITSRRPGMILLVVIALLTLFAVVGLAFVLYSQSQADAARIFREAQYQTAVNAVPEVPPQDLLDEFLRQLIYDLTDNATYGQDSVLRGHSLARTMYGYNDGFADSTKGMPNIYAYNGLGRLNVNHTFTVGGGMTITANERDLVNYQYHSGEFLRDPERLGARPAYNAGTVGRMEYVGGFNPNYTYPDHNNMYLAAIGPDGRVLIPSYFRPWIGNFGPLDPANPNWTNTTDKSLKYKVLRPHRSHHPNFPLPADRGGDVKNFIGGIGYDGGNNDSIWVDIGSPVRTLPDGRKYKALFAPLIVDQDGLLNLNIHGNIRRNDTLATNPHVSHQGFGPHEVNLGKLLTAMTGVGTNMEWPNLFRGNPSVPAVRGRYGPDGKPLSGGPWAGAGPVGYPATGMPYHRVDFDGCKSAPPTASTQPMSLSWTTPATQFSCFPNYNPGNGYDAQSDEVNDHPLLFNVFGGQNSDDVVFDASTLYFLKRQMPSGSQHALCPVGQLCPANFANQRARLLVTTHSWDIDHPGYTPGHWDPVAWKFVKEDHQESTPSTYLPNSVPAASEPIGVPFTPSQPPVGSDFAPDRRGAAAALGKLDLNRQLPAYPPIVPKAGEKFDPNALAYIQARDAREKFAREIFERLEFVTGADRTQPKASEAYKARRWLAQLAVNIVDYIDEDDVMTVFQWDPVNNEYVFGTEMCKLVLNEAYLEWLNDPKDDFSTKLPAASMDYHVKLWVELHNVMDSLAQNSPGFPPYENLVRLQMPISPDGDIGYAVYKVQVTTPSNLTNLWRDENTDGHVDDETKLKAEISEWIDHSQNVIDEDKWFVVHPSNKKYAGVDKSNQGFYVVGADQMPGTNSEPTLKLPGPYDRTTQPSALMYKMPLNTAPTNAENPWLLLRRLACPYLPPQPDKSKPNYNPYVTVDTFPGVPQNDMRTHDQNGIRPVPNRTTMHSSGRRQPHAADESQLVLQNPNMLQLGQPKHTFYRHNARENSAGVDPQAPGVNPNAAGQTLTFPFQWIPHLDRKLISPMELLQVSAFRPSELTRRFVTGTGAGVAHNHRAPWFKDSLRLFRLFELVGCRSRVTDTGLGGRIPGKININSIWPDTIYQSEILSALIDPQPGNSTCFNDATTVGAIFEQIFRNRSFNHLMHVKDKSDPTYKPGPAANDKPFWGPSAIAFSGGTEFNPTEFGIRRTLLSPHDSSDAENSDARRMFHAPLAEAATPSHPYQRMSLLNKIWNNVTTRSNCFVLYLTVGFFEVKDDSVMPVRLGSEIGFPTTNIRHHMFAVIDRSALMYVGPRHSTTTSTAISTTGPQTVTVGDLRGIRTGTILTIDDGANRETVVVTQAPLPVPVAAPAGQFRAVFQKTHSAGAKVYVPVLPDLQPAPHATLTNNIIPSQSAVPQISQPVATLGIVPGTLVTIGVGEDQETVVAAAPAGNGFKAIIRKSHPAGTPVWVSTLPGNPGPQPSFVARDNSAVVPFYLVID